MKLVRALLAFPVLIVAVPLYVLSLLFIGLASLIAGENFITDLEIKATTPNKKGNEE